MPENAGMVARRRMDVAQSRAQIRDVTNDPKINPAGKGQFRGTYAPFGNRSEHYTEAKPDSRHAARLRGKKARSWADKAMKR
jgi:hypothetical protein